MGNKAAVRVAEEWSLYKLQRIERLLNKYVRVLTLSFVEKHFIGTILVLRKGYLQEHLFVGEQLTPQSAVC